ncbi:MAG: DUF370 domain-containing protein [Oscillospiraceae bacterium]
MYLHIGQETVLNTKDILGIFDIDSSSVSKNTRDFLAASEKNKKVINVTNELPKSFIITVPNENLYISQISSQTLKKRSGFIDDEKNITYLKK